MLNIAGWKYDYAQVVYAVLQDCEHARRSIDDDDFERDIKKVAREKLDAVHAAYVESSGTPEYWTALEKEVFDVVLPQYTDAARAMSAQERTHFGVWRGGDIAARAAFALGGLVVGSIIIALPFIPIFEEMFAFGLTLICFLYPDIKRYTAERRYAKLLNALVAASAQYQSSARLRYMTSADLDKALALPPSEEATRPAGTRSSS